MIGIPFYVWDLAERFHDDVVDDFVAEYAAGRTPNPCLRCNEKIKFAAVLDRAVALGFDAVVTGHYARLEATACCAARSTRPRTSPTCSACSPPTAGARGLPARRLDRRREVRAEAAARGLAVADKPDSHDICFIADGDTRGFLAEPARGARRARSSTRVRGGAGPPHRGRCGFTVGQRKGLACRARPPTAGRATCWASSRSRGGSRWARRRRSTSTGSRPRRRSGTARPG